jgi:hypothetical protein
VATDKNELGVEFKLKNYKAQSREIEVVVHANKMAHTKLKSKISYI